MTIIRGLEDLIYKESLDEVETLGKCVRKDKNSWCCLAEAMVDSMIPCVHFGLSSHSLHRFPHSPITSSPRIPNTQFLNISGRICSQGFSLLSL